VTSPSAEVPRGDPQNPLSWAQLTDKFRDCAKPVLDAGRIERAIGLIETMDDLPIIRELTETLTAER
jgi:2-methylcitrate dehydratase PrpD